MKMITIRLGGQINKYNAHGVEQRIYRTLEASQHDVVILDAEKVETISDTGLELISRLKEKEKNLFIRNVSPEIRDLFLQKGLGDLVQSNGVIPTKQHRQSGSL